MKCLVNIGVLKVLSHLLILAVPKLAANFSSFAQIIMQQ